ncbi:MAG TPA: PxKF domain-containing protein, partial [Candidatus Angelobacter sp.]|nr:PxKF domain-containing protein [Candidatus Angelobacter sp.]
TIPVRFSLDGQIGEDVLFSDAQVYECGGWRFGASVDARSTGGSGGLRYDAEDEQYVFAWRTDREWAGDCMTLVLTFRDGTYVTADVTFS